MKSRQPRRVISVITDAFSPFHREVLDGLQPHFSAAGYGTLAVAGRDVRTDRLIETALSSKAGHGRFGTGLEVCGSIIVCGATPPGMSQEAIATFVSELSDGPVISLGITLPGVPSVTIDWDKSIDELMAHMVSDPNRRRFVFVRGFAADPHSERREAGFRATLAASGIEVDERLIVSGHYSTADALHAVDKLLIDGHRFDGVVAANDDMAVGVIGALHRHGLTVPEDVIVAGFDDSLAAFQSEPPLTTALLDTESLTRASASLLVDAIESEFAPSPNVEIEIDSWLVRRASTRPAIVTRSANRPAEPLDISTVLAQRIIHRWESDRAPIGFDLDVLAKSAAATLTAGDDSFRAARLSMAAPIDPFIDRAEAVWLRHALRVLWSVVKELRDGEVPSTGLRAMVDQLNEVERDLRPTERLIETERRAHHDLQERLVMRLASCSNQSELWDALRTGLRSLGMANAWVAIDEPDDDGPDGSVPRTSTGAGAPPSESMRLLFSLGDSLPDGGEVFRRSSVLPDRFDPLLEAGLHVLVPLRAGESDIGYIVVEPSGDHLFGLEAIASGVAQVLRHVRQIAELETQTARLRIANETLDVLARRDALTGLANRKLLVERLDEEVARPDADGHLSVLFIDLDGFKQINDTLGHAAGDQVLRIVAERLGGLLGEDDFLARLGGDEFIMLLRHGAGSTRPSDIAEEAVDMIRLPFDLAGATTQVSASVGIAQCPVDGSTTDELMRNSDAAMYAAKASGKNRFARFSADLSTDLSSE